MQGPVVGRLAVLSPHLDDAVLSLGAYIRSQTRRSTQVVVVTVMGYRPQDWRTRAGVWDHQCGFATAAAAAAVRRAEDLRACSLLGATPLWLPFRDATYGETASDEEIWAEVLAAVGDADAVLAPGFPLAHADHQRLARIVRERSRDLACPVGFYAEQPYATGEMLGVEAGRGLGRLTELGRFVRRLVRDEGVPPATDQHWQHEDASRADRWAKARAIIAYRSQLRRLGIAPLVGALAFETARGGELIAWSVPR